MSEDPLADTFTRVLTRLTLLNLPDPVPNELGDELLALLTFESGNAAPAMVGDGVLVWRGYLTGGLATLYEQVAPLVDHHGLAALIADERLEVHVAADDDKVMLIGPFTDAMTVSRRVWEHRVECALDPDELAQWFVFDWLSDSATQLLEAGGHAEDDETRPWAAPAGTLAQVPPGRIDYTLLDDATFHLVESYDPDGEIEDAVVECRPVGGEWRTDFQAPCLDRADADGAEVDRWRVAQCRWSDEAGSWMPAVCAEVDLATVVAHLPPALRPWAIRRTEDAIAFLDDAAADCRGSAARIERDRLRRELDQLAGR